MSEQRYKHIFENNVSRDFRSLEHIHIKRHSVGYFKDNVGCGLSLRNFSITRRCVECIGKINNFICHPELAAPLVADVKEAYKGGGSQSISGACHLQEYTDFNINKSNVGVETPTYCTQKSNVEQVCPTDNNISLNTKERSDIVSCLWHHSPRKIAFTLAEVLITLGIIGVVAAMTLPALIANYEKQVTITKLKKAQSILTQGIRLAELDNGDICTWFGSNPISVRGNVFMDNYILPYFKTIKSSSRQGSGTDMRIYGYQKAHDVFQQLDGSTVYSRYEMESFITPDNMYFGFNLIDNKGFNVGAANASTFRHAWIPLIVDINGSNGPNRVGRDVFYFEILSENCGSAKVVGYAPSKSMSASDGYKLKVNYGAAINNCKKGSSGDGCFVKILNDGWKIKDDYPW